MQSNVRKVLVDLESPDTAPVTRKTTVIRPVGLDDPSPAKAAAHDYASRQTSFVHEESGATVSTRDDILPITPPVLPVTITEDLKPLIKKIKVTNLDSGKFYFFNLVAGFFDVEGSPSSTESLLVDGLPLASARPTLKIDTSSSSPRIVISVPPAECPGSAIQSYRLYHSTTDSSMKESFLVSELKVHGAPEHGEESKSTEIKFTINDPELRVSHWFRVSAVNAMGEGPLSEVTERGLIGKFLENIYNFGPQETHF